MSAPPNPRTVAVTFGPSRSLNFPRAVDYAQRHLAGTQVEPGRWRAAVILTEERSQYRRLERLLAMVGHWGSTEVTVAGELEAADLAARMADCAPRWLRSRGECRVVYHDGPYDRCYVCPLFDPAKDPWHVREQVPDTVPKDWS
ncbi:MAG: hypothetical protein WD739_09475 [Actinomycetota bacterium]